jgi:hypothetical protein
MLDSGCNTGPGNARSNFKIEEHDMSAKIQIHDNFDALPGDGKIVCIRFVDTSDNVVRRARVSRNPENSAIWFAVLSDNDHILYYVPGYDVRQWWVS